MLRMTFRLLIFSLYWYLCAWCKAEKNLSQETETAESAEVYVNKQSAKNKCLVTLKTSNVDIVLNTSYLIMKCFFLSLFVLQTLQVKDCLWKKILYMLSFNRVREGKELILQLFSYTWSVHADISCSRGAPWKTCSCKNVQGSWGYITR